MIFTQVGTRKQNGSTEKGVWRLRKHLLGSENAFGGLAKALIGVRKRVANCESAFWKVSKTQNAKREKTKSKSYRPFPSSSRSELVPVGRLPLPSSAAANAPFPPKLAISGRLQRPPAPRFVYVGRKPRQSDDVPSPCYYGGRSRAPLGI